MLSVSGCTQETKIAPNETSPGVSAATSQDADICGGILEPMWAVGQLHGFTYFDYFDQFNAPQKSLNWSHDVLHWHISWDQLKSTEVHDSVTEPFSFMKESCGWGRNSEDLLQPVWAADFEKARLETYHTSGPSSAKLTRPGENGAYLASQENETSPTFSEWALNEYLEERTRVITGIWTSLKHDSSAWLIHLWAKVWNRFNTKNLTSCFLHHVTCELSSMRVMKMVNSLNWQLIDSTTVSPQLFLLCGDVHAELKMLLWAMWVSYLGVLKCSRFVYLSPTYKIHTFGSEALQLEILRNLHNTKPAVHQLMKIAR